MLTEQEVLSLGFELEQELVMHQYNDYTYGMPECEIWLRWHKDTNRWATCGTFVQSAAHLKMLIDFYNYKEPHDH